MMGVTLSAQRFARISHVAVERREEGRTCSGCGVTVSFRLGVGVRSGGVIICIIERSYNVA